MRELSLFTGAGGGLLASHLLGWRTVGAVEWETYPVRVLRQRQLDGMLDEFPIWHMDINQFNQRIAPSYAGLVDVITAGFPCQPFSAAGKRRGEDDPRNQWPATIAAINIIRPAFCFLENVPGLLSARDTVCNECGYVESHWDDEREARLCGACGAEVVETAENTFWYFASILRDLAESGYDARWRCLSAAELGAPHKRDRLWIVATDAEGAGKHRELGITEGEGAAQRIPQGQERAESDSGSADVADADRSQQGRGQQQKRGQARRNAEPARYGTQGDVVARYQDEQEHNAGGSSGGSGAGVGWWSTEPDVGRVVNGMDYRVDRLKALGNGQVPAVAAAAWLLLTEEL